MRLAQIDIQIGWWHDTTVLFQAKWEKEDKLAMIFLFKCETYQEL